jgi:adenylylsulfate kinase
METETHTRTFVKTIVWRAVATLLTGTVIYTFTGAAGDSIEIALFAAVISTVAYYIHERAWNKVRWGRK